MPEKIHGCGTLVRIDTGDGDEFTTQGQCDAVTPFGESKSIVEAPTLECTMHSEVGKEEQSTMEFTQYWDPTDADHERIDDNFEDSKTDPSVKTIAVQLVTPSIPAAAGATTVVTYEAPCQIASISKESITPDGYWKRTVTLLRTGAIAKTVVTTPAPT